MVSVSSGKQLRSPNRSRASVPTATVSREHRSSITTTTSRPKYIITPPTTTGDDGTPSDSLSKDAKRIFDFVKDERHLTAYQLYESVIQRVEKERLEYEQVSNESPKKGFRMGRKKNKPLDKRTSDLMECTEVLETRGDEIELLKKRNKIFKEAQHAFDENRDWVLSQTFFGITTYYRRERDDSLSIKLEGVLKGVPLFDQVAVLREVDLHFRWAPFCSSSLLINHLDKLDTLGWFCLGVPQFGLARDGVFRAIGCDNMAEDGSILLVGQGVEDRPADVPYDIPFLAEGLEDQDIPDPPSRLGSARLTLKIFSGKIEILSPTSVRTKLIANINPNLPFIPQSLLDLVMRKMCGVLLAKLQTAAMRVGKNPVKNPHAKKMRQDESFYKVWLKAKFESYCKMVGWDMPPIPAFNLSETELEEEYFENYQNRTASTADDDSAVSSVSPITMESSHSSNPILQYLRELEAKTEAKKHAKVAAAYAKAADRLKPKAFSAEESARLLELKAAKARRRASRSKVRLPNTPVSSHDSSSMSLDSVIPRNEELKPEDQTSITNLHKHGKTTRMIVTTILALTLLITLNADRELGYTKFLAATDHNWLDTVLLDFATLVYLGICAFVYFLFCNVTLVYCFDTLELGMKTGRKMKQHYSAQVQYAVGVFSVVLVGVSVGNECFAVFCRQTTWNGIVVWRFISRHSLYVWDLLSSQRERLPQVSRAMSSVGISLWTIIASFVSFIKVVLVRFIEFATQVLRTLLVDNFTPGYYLLHLSILIGNTSAIILEYLTEQWETYRGRVLSIYEGEEEIMSWRENAIESTRFVLSYTAVFLFSVLLLFTASTRKERDVEASFSELLSRGSNDGSSSNLLLPIQEETRSMRSASVGSRSGSIIRSSQNSSRKTWRRRKG